MKVFIAGATGAIGQQLIPLLVDRGHDVVGMTRSPEKLAQIRSSGAEGVVADALDRDAVVRAVVEASPDVVVHELTALSGVRNYRQLDREFEATNRLRTEGTDNLLAAARAAGATRLVAQSYAGWPYARVGGAVKTEEDPLDPDPPENARRSLAAIRHLEEAVTGADLDGVVLRYGALYGPGTSLALDGELVELVRGRRFPVVGDGGGVWSFVHVGDAAAATALAIERGEPGVYNVVDDEPAPVREWLPELARAVGARPPRRVPSWVGRLAVGEVGVSMMTRIRGASNAKAKAQLGWQPRYGTWRDGFRHGLGRVTPRTTQPGAAQATR